MWDFLLANLLKYFASNKLLLKYSMKQKRLDTANMYNFNKTAIIFYASEICYDYKQLFNFRRINDKTPYFCMVNHMLLAFVGFACCVQKRIGIKK